MMFSKVFKRMPPIITAIFLMLCAFYIETGSAEFSFPNDLFVIEPEAFANVQLPETLTLPDELETIGERAFAGCTGLKRVYIPYTVSEIGDGAFPEGTVIDCESGSYAEEWAEANGYTVAHNTKYYALVIGQGYTDTDYELEGCLRDADAVTNMLKTMTETPYSVTTVKNVTAKGILSNIASAFSAATENDVCLFYYSGHGNDKTGDLFGDDFNLVTIKALKAALDAIPANKIVLLDSCFSGNMISSNGEEESAASPAEVNAHIIDIFSEGGPSANGVGGNYYILTACRSDEYSYQLGKTVSYGAFTRYLLLGSGYDEYNLCSVSTLSADKDGDSAISLSEGYTYAYTKILDVLGTNYSQHVQSYPSGSNYILWKK